MPLRDFLSRLEPEAIPFPLSRLYSLITSSRMVRDYYVSVAAQVLKHLSAGRILDIGTGPGRLPIIIASGNKYVRVTGLDLSPDMVGIAARLAAKKGIANVDFKAGSATSPSATRISTSSSAPSRSTTGESRIRRWTKYTGYYVSGARHGSTTSRKR
jgi:SAM-dependent methyltransferase